MIIGGGIAGLSAGIALRKAGYGVTLYEQAPTIEPMGAALSIWPNAVAGLDWLGCGDAVRAGAARVDTLALRQREGRILFGPVDLSPTDSLLPMRALLQGVLLDALGLENCRFGIRIDDIAERGDRVVALAAGEEVDAAALVVVADGIHSAIGSRLLGNAPVFAGYVGALGLANGAGGKWEQGRAEEIWGERERFGLLDAGDGRRYWFYMASAEEASASERMTLAAIRARGEGWPDALAATLAASRAEDVIPVAIHARAAPKALGRGRVICIGDAAHAMEPNQGQGACQGIEDAWALGLLAQRYLPEEILPHFERLRLARLRAIMRDSALVGRAAHSPRTWERRLATGIFGLVPSAIDRLEIRKRLRPPDYERLLNSV